jgi:hypothetical protein
MHGSSKALSSQEDLARSGYSLNTKIIFLEHPSIFLAIYGKACIDIWQFFLNVFSNSGYIENLEKH